MAEPVRILQVFHSMDCGGAENMIMNLYRKTDRTKVQFDFLVHAGHAAYFDEEIRSLGGRIFIVPYFKVTNLRTYEKAVNRFFDAHPEYKVVHGHVGSCAHIYLKIARQHGCFTIAHSHNTRKKASARQILFRLFSYRTRHTADYFMACGEKAGDYLFGKKITGDASRYSILKNAIDTGKFAFRKETRERIRRELNMEEAFLIGHVGRFDRQKNHAFLLRIFAEISKREPSARLLLVGEGALKAETEELAKRLGLQQKIVFAGLRSDVNDLLMGMDCMVFPSLNEGLPVTVVEAQTTGLRVVMSDVITKEVRLTDLVECVSLTKSAAQWADIVLQKRVTDRTAYPKQVMQSGYDISASAAWLTEFYLAAAAKAERKNQLLP